MILDVLCNPRTILKTSSKSLKRSKKTKKSLVLSRKSLPLSETPLYTLYILNINLDFLDFFYVVCYRDK